jgi:peptidoglycan/xylan/chitin deacetylase (PgdA/CDA1 family)
VSLRTLLAPALAAINRLVRGLLPTPMGAVRILILHDVPPAARDAFIRLLDHVAAGPGFVTPAEAAQRLSGAVPADGRTPVLLSFDDGFASNLEVARDILEPRGLRALFFVCPGLIDLPAAERRAAIAAHVFRGHSSAQGLDLIGWPDLAALAAAGHEIGCHSLSHDCLAGLNPPELEREVASAKARMAEMLGRTTAWFAFPFGDIGSIDASALAAIGSHFRLCRSGIRGTAHAGSHPLALPAESAELGASWPWLRLAAEGGLAPLYRKPLARLAALAHQARGL